MLSKLFRLVELTAFAALSATLLVAQGYRYNVTTLPTLGGTAGQGISVNNRGWVSGSANLDGDSISKATLWLGGHAFSLGALGGDTANSTMAWPVKNNIGLLVGISDTAEDAIPGDLFSCYPFFATGSPTGKICQGFRWMNGIMKALPPFPGGHNSYATAANNRGQIVGWAENGRLDDTCLAGVQRYQFRAVIWEPDGAMRELQPLPGTGDTTTAATAINDRGQVVGISGICDQAVGRFSARHAVMWEHGVPRYLGSLGGAAWNTPAAINNNGVVVGFADVPGDQGGTPNYVAFIWTQSGGMKKLAQLPGETRGAAFGINDDNQVVGLSRGPGIPTHATLWQNGTAVNLNTVTNTGAPYLIFANDINDHGVITGEAADASGAPAFQATPESDDDSAIAPESAKRFQSVPERVRQRFLRQWGWDLNR